MSGTDNNGAALTHVPVVYDNISIGAAPIWVMQEAGIFRKYGLDVSLDFVQGTPGTAAVVAGQYDVGFISAPAVVASDAQQPTIKLVALVFPKLIYSLVASKTITSVDMLRGKTFGIATVGDSSDTATRLIARQLGLDPDTDIKILQVGNSPARYAALVSGNVDAVIADPMDVVRARRDGLNVLAEANSLSIAYASGVFGMRSSFLAAQPDTARLFLEAVVDGMQYYKSHPDEVATIAGAHLSSTDTDALHQAVQTFSAMMPENPEVIASAIQPIIDDEANRVPSLKSATMDQFVDNSILEGLQQNGFVARVNAQ